MTAPEATKPKNETVSDRRGIDRVRPTFDEQKATAAACVLIKAAGGKIRYFRLLKLLYLADRQSWQKYNRPITGDAYVSMDHGPVLSKTYNLIRSDVPRGPWFSAIERVGRHEVKLKDETPDLGALSQAEIELLHEAYKLHEANSQWKIRDLTHALPEWQDPKGSSIPIEPEDILRALEKDPEEIDEARLEAAETAYLDTIL